MNLQREPLETPDINLTPLIDVVFLLLIFFMVTTTFAPEERRLTLELPSGQTGMAPAEASVIVTLGANGELALDGKPMASKGALARALREQRSKHTPGTLSLLLRADARTEHGAVIGILDLARQLGIQEVNVATRTAD